MNKKEILELIPASWDTFPFGLYMKTVDIPISEDGRLSGLDNMIKVISAITDIPVEELEGEEMAFIQKVANRLAFIKDLPKGAKKGCIEWKAIEEVTYNDFVSFLTLSKDAVHSMPEIIKTFSKEPLTDDEINNMSVSEVYAGFFMLRRYQQKYIRRLVRKEIRNLMRIKSKSLLTPFKRS